MPTKSDLSMLNITCRTVVNLKLQEQQWQRVLDTRRLAPGSYTVELVNGGKHIEAQKLVVRP